MICDALHDLKAVDVEVRVNESKKSIVVCIPFDDRAKGVCRKELVLGAVELLQGFLPWSAEDDATAQLPVSPRTPQAASRNGGGSSGGGARGGGAGGGGVTSSTRVFRERAFNFSSPVIMQSTR